MVETFAKQCRVVVYGVNFDFNEATLRQDSEPVLEELLKLFEADPPLAVEIGGHTDNVGLPACKLKLSAECAEVVKTWLVTHRVAVSRITTHGCGDTMPAASNAIDGKHNPADRAKDRRVEFERPNCRMPSVN